MSDLDRVISMNPALVNLSALPNKFMTMRLHAPDTERTHHASCSSRRTTTDSFSWALISGADSWDDPTLPGRNRPVAWSTDLGNRCPAYKELVTSSIKLSRSKVVAKSGALPFALTAVRLLIFAKSSLWQLLVVAMNRGRREKPTNNS